MSSNGRRRRRDRGLMVPEAEFRSYYGRPILKEPAWTLEVPWYFFTGGLAGASAPLAVAARMTGNQPLARSALTVAGAGITASVPLLVSDLGRPERFHHMLRVFKPTSPMSMGSWALAAMGPAAVGAAISDRLGILPGLGRVAEVVSGVIGPSLCTYTGALVANTAVPVWHEARHELPLVFAGSALASAGAASVLLTPAADAGPARRLAVVGAVVELGRPGPWSGASASWPSPTTRARRAGTPGWPEAAPPWGRRPWRSPGPVGAGRRWPAAGCCWRARRLSDWRSTRRDTSLRVIPSTSSSRNGSERRRSIAEERSSQPRRPQEVSSWLGRPNPRGKALSGTGG